MCIICIALLVSNMYINELYTYVEDLTVYTNTSY